MLEFFTPKLVWNIVIVCIAIIVLLNFILNLNRTQNDTVNNRLNFWANNKFYFITFLWGVLGGHFFLGTIKPLFCCNWWLPVLILIIISGILFFRGKRKPEHYKVKPYWQILFILTGLFYGHIIWSQRHEPIVFDKDNKCINQSFFCND